MIGAFPIGSVPLGSNQSAGKQTIELGSALSTADGLLMNTGVSLGKGDASASSGATSTLSKLSTLPASSNSNAVDATTKTLPRMLFAHAIASGESIDNLQIRLKIDRADATSNALNLTGLQRIDFGQAQAQSRAGLALTRSTIHVDQAQALASAIDIEKLSISMGLGSASLSANAFGSTLSIYLAIGKAMAESSGVDFSGLGLALFKADAIANTNKFGTGLQLITAGLSASSFDVAPFIKIGLDSAEAIAQAYEFEPMILDLVIGNMIASANDADINYIVNDVPEIIVTRSEDLTENVLTVLNDIGRNINIYRADDHRGLLQLLSQNQTYPYTDSGLDESLNYKYKAAFVILGTKGGQAVVVEGEKSDPIYTIGNRTL